MKLNIGCGNSPKKGFVNLDIVKLKGVDVIHNLEVSPLPFKTSSVSYILADNVFEHIQNLDGLLNEIYRISKNEAITKIIVPHFRSVGAFSDPTHKRWFTSSTFDYFQKDNPNNFYIKTNFQIVSKKLLFSFGDAKKIRAKIYNLLVMPIEWLANLNPQLYDNLFSNFISPHTIVCELKVVK